MKTNFLKTILFIATTVVLISCDKDFNNIGEDIIGDEHYGMTQDLNTTVNAYTKSTGPIQTNNLDVNPLGIYDNPVFGKTTASFVTQVQLASVAPSLPALTPTSIALGALKSRTVTKVTLYIPYFSKITGTKTSGGTYDYALDSIVNYEDRDNKIKLSIFENNRFMGSADTSNSLLTPYLFYSNNTDSNNNSISAPIGTRLNEDSTDPTNFPTSNNDEFVFKNTEIPITSTSGGTTTTTYKAPGMNLRLRSSYFNTKILLADADKLKTNAAFTEYFRGLYFKVEQSGTDRGCMNMLDFKKGTITIEYKETSNSTVAPVTPATDVVTDKSIVLNLTGNTASLISNASALPTYTDRLTIKGGEGSVAMIDLFGQNLVAGNPNLDVKKYDRASNSVIAGSNGISDEVDNLKVKGWLINEANLTFYIDDKFDPTYTGSGVMGTILNGNPAVEPYRLFLYDARNKRPIIDYYYDGSTSSYPNSGKVVHGGIIDRKVTATNPNGRGVKYKIRITDHIRNLINKDSTNVTLGLSVCKTINNQFFGKQKNASSTATNLNYFPTSSIMNPLGTIIWGTGTAVPVGKEMKLEIWYTKAN